MLTIDLLKGQGIPIKSRPGVAMVFAVSIAVPMICAILGLGQYVRGNIMLSMTEQETDRFRARVIELTDNVSLHRKSEQEVTTIKGCLGEVGLIMRNYIQWSPVLEEVARSIPESIVLDELVVQAENIFRHVPSKRDPTKNITITLPKRRLIVNLYGRLGGSSDEAILTFIERLKASEVFKKEVYNIRQISQKADEKEDLMSYSIECVFRVH